MSGIIGTSHSKSKAVGKSIDTAKAWVKWQGTSTVAIISSFNVSSVTDNGTGDWTVNFEKDFRDDKFCCILASAGGSGYSDGRFVRHDNDSSTGNYARTRNFQSNQTGLYDTNELFLAAWGN